MLHGTLDRRELLVGGALAAGAVLLGPARADAAPAPILFGVNQHLTEKGAKPKVLEAQMGLAKQLGAQISRNGLHWKKVEQQRGQYDWSLMDTAIGLLDGAGIKMLWTVSGGAPAWFGTSIPSSKTDPAEWKRWLDAYARFVRAAAHRYRHVQHWELWNEQNLHKFWDSGGTRRSNPGDYKLWYRTIRAAILAEHPGAHVSVGGLTNATLTNPYQQSGEQFLQALLAKPAATVDRLAVHIYCRDDRSPDVKGDGNNFVDFDLYRKQLSRAGRLGTKMWITEWGWSTGAGGVSEAAQADYIRRSLNRIVKDWSSSTEVATIFIDYDRPGLHFGLFGPAPTFTPKPSARVFRQFVDAYRKRA